MLGSWRVDPALPSRSMHQRTIIHTVCSLIIALLLGAGLHVGGFASTGPTPSTETDASVPSGAVLQPNSSPDIAQEGAGKVSSLGRYAIPLKARQTLKAIQDRQGDPLPGYVGGRTFQNREQKLPQGYYREYDVTPLVRGKTGEPSGSSLSDAPARPTIPLITTEPLFR